MNLEDIISGWNGCVCSGGSCDIDFVELTGTISTRSEGGDTHNVIEFDVSYNDLVALVEDGKIPCFTPTAEMVEEFDGLSATTYYLINYQLLGDTYPSAFFSALACYGDGYNIILSNESATDNLIGP